MGEVYRAEDLTLGQPVALKFLPPAMSRDEDALRRFRNEVKVARKVSHPNVCRVYDVGEVDGNYFLSMEYVDGEDLGSLLRRIGRLPPDKAVEIARKLCGGLHAAHEKGVLHRDLKPANVMLDGRGQVLLTDFGLAGLSEQITGQEIRSGTPAYMAPEQLSGKEVTAKSDIYSLGLVIYELFTGKRPFHGDTLADLMRARSEVTPESLSTVVRDLDPSVERVILRCLDPDPSRRPASALAVSAALPGGDPLAAALAAGEMPSPQMVAAAGEGAGLAPRFAVSIFVAIIVGIIVCTSLAVRNSALEIVRPEYPPAVLKQKARDLVKSLGYTARPADTEHGFYWQDSYIGYVTQNEKPFPGWPQVLSKRPSILGYWFRQSPYPMTGAEFHDDLLTPGIVMTETPPAVLSGMIEIELDDRGRLLQFQSVPEQKQDAMKESPAPDWNPLFAAAELAPAQLQTAEPEWTWLATSDTRAAWTGMWPGTNRPLRVEAAALRGRAVAFSVLGPWTKTDRMPPPQSIGRGDISLLIICAMALAVLVGGALLARRNLASAKGDRRGAFRIAAFIFYVHMALWLTRAHFVLSIGTIGMLMIAICTSAFYGVLLWTVYLALEPYVRRYWPRTLISWTRVLSGQVRDTAVGRDTLFGIALGVIGVLIGRAVDLVGEGASTSLSLLPGELLLGTRSTLGLGLTVIPHAVREALIFFFILFLLRVLLRNEWLGAAGFVLIWTLIHVLMSDRPLISGIANVMIYSLTAIVVLRFGLLALAVSVLVNSLMGISPTLDTSAWYFPNLALPVLSSVALAVWALYAATGRAVHHARI